MITPPKPPTPHSRALAAVLALHAGDSLGATVEFSPWKNIKHQYPRGVRSIIGGGPFHWPAGHATDDTDLTRAVLLGYRDHFGDLVGAVAQQQQGQQAKKKQNGDEVAAVLPVKLGSPMRSTNRHRARGKDAMEKEGEEKDVRIDEVSWAIARSAASYMLAWESGSSWPTSPLRAKGLPPVDIGGATQSGLDSYGRTLDPLNAGAGQGSAGNGSLMRCIPTGLLQASRQRRIEESVAISAVTHDDMRCTGACVVYNEIVAGLMAGKAAEEAVQEGIEVGRELVSEGRLDEIVVEAVEAARRLDIKRMAEEGPETEREWVDVLPNGAAGYVLETLSVGVAAVLDKRPLVDVLVDVVRLGEDTDTNAAVAGGLLGARDGIEALPQEWVEKLQFADEFTEIIAQLVPL